MMIKIIVHHEGGGNRIDREFELNKEESLSTNISNICQVQEEVETI
jgi:hypothetical protein